MSATAKVTLKVEVEGLTKDYSCGDKFTHSVTPEEVFEGEGIIGTTACDLDLGMIEDTDVSGILLFATGTADTDAVGILVNDSGSGTPSTSAGNMVLNAGEGTYINLYGGLDDTKVIRLKGKADTTGIKYLVFGKHT